MLSQQRAATATSTMPLQQQQQCMVQRLRLPAGQVRRPIVCRRVCEEVQAARSSEQKQLEHQTDLPLQQQQQQQQRPALKKQSLLSALPAPLQRGVASASNAVSSALAPARQVIDKVDPRVRGLILLNAMTLLMGSNWVVLKDSNDSFDPVSSSWFGCWLFCMHGKLFCIMTSPDKLVTLLHSALGV